ncbi:MAG: type 4a pilus biogenesis protein PilO, partial [bacterium]|nr:type 4a pilus biogenesis protein PilO [bacterium]
PLPPVPDDQMRKETLPYKIIVHGDYHQIAGFINRLERFERYLKVSKLNIEAAKDGVSKASFELSTFRFLTETPGA